VAVSFSCKFTDTWEPFVRAGYFEDGGGLREWPTSMGID
jgi:hypothetical protein